ncbi:hypothetical protein BLNAU_19049 [Blattamonas nauphoetae]|uniref:Uncharacterized protein n=1 Tax=Blattamonas nauphoetae TaxID=2049346 RepID=A0ABQ9X351_9EUKA|nr:hypothetical protein BLNAU_19049 [Blattamonas nauphoetae]
MSGTGTSTMPIHLTNLTFTADPALPDKTVDVLVDGFNLSETISNSTIPIFDKTMANRAWGSDSVSGANTSLLAYLVPIEVEVAVQTTPGYDVGKCGHYELFCKSFQQSLVRVVNNVARIVFYSSVELGFDAIVPKPLTITSRTHPGEVSVLSSGRIVQSHAGTTTLDTIHFSLPATSTRTELFLVTSGNLNVKSCSLSPVSGTIPFGVLNVTGGSVELLSLTLSAQTISTLPFSFDGTTQTSLTSLSLTDTNTPSNELMKIVGAIQSSPITIKNSEFSKTTAAQQQMLSTQNQFAPICSWSTGALSFTTCTATLTSTRLAGLTNGGIVVIGATVTLSQCTFHQNGKTPTDADFPSLQRNIVCSGGGSVIVSSVAGGDGVDPDSHFWISEGDCTVTLPNPQSNTPFVTPTLSDAVYSANDTHLTVTLTGTLLFPCGLKLSVFDMPEYLVDRKTVISEIVEVSWTESEISIVLDRTDFPTLNEMLAWRAAVLFGADHSKQTNAVRIKDGEEFLVPIPPTPPTPTPTDPTPDPPPTDPTDPPSPPTHPVDPVDPKDPAEGGLKFPMWLIGVIVGALVAAVAVIVVVFVVRRNSQPEQGVYLYIELDEENAHQPGHFETATMNRVKQECTLALEALEDDLMDFGGNGMAGKVEAMACSFPHSRVLADESDSVAARLEASGKEGVEKEMGWKQFLKSVLDGLAFLNAENTHSPVFAAINPHMLFIADVGHPADTTQEQEEVRPMRNMQKYQTESTQPGKEVLIGMVGDEPDGAETKRTLQHSMRREEVQERFSAPEVKRGEKADVSTALFSLGMVLLELQAEDKELTELVGEMMKAERQARPSLELLRVRVGREGKEGREDESRVVSVGVDPKKGRELTETPLHKTRTGKKESFGKRKEGKMEKVEEGGLDNTPPITLTEQPESLNGDVSVMKLEAVEEDAKPKKDRHNPRRPSLKSPKQPELFSLLALEEAATEQPNDGYEEELSMAGSENEELTRPMKKTNQKKGKGKGKAKGKGKKGKTPSGVKKT